MWVLAHFFFNLVTKQRYTLKACAKQSHSKDRVLSRILSWEGSCIKRCLYTEKKNVNLTFFAVKTGETEMTLINSFYLILAIVILANEKIVNMTQKAL